ncbi:filamentous hemagglutinin family protein [Sphingosinicella sp. LHD-64]|uniref:filamentous haemagglutinin family protein n=1 Tax=Sphingosinicella sp. LHD-64 TaxID=3072139 RepID=UPI00280D5863|nr:filamentous haemagglutinin family protein [Sphingosinicella sp. LHD-64]MDQ8757557.1 filamentous hemagglutinin family protein [Sphingosinicella sp. LHD-64]
MTVKTRSFRNTLLIGASIGSMMVAGVAYAQNRPFARTAADPAAAAARAAQNAATRNAAAEAAAARTRAALTRAAQVRSQMDAAQQAARAAAAAAQSNIPNGLGEGGLHVANGVIIDPGAFNADDPRLGEANLWLGANGPTQQQTADGRTEVNIEQTQSKAILTWDSFNVGRETDLVFDQQGNAEWVALNRVNSVTADPSRILGNIRADGQVYIINRNGVIFGGTSQVNVHSLIAASMDIGVAGVRHDTPITPNIIRSRNQRFVNGILSGANNFAAGIAFGEDNGTILSTAPDTGVTVEVGARLTAGNYGQIALFGRHVTNGGTIETPDGQALLAAGSAIFLNRNYAAGLDQLIDPDLRGFTVGVGGGGGAANDGIISADRGNITLTGASVFQNGLLEATTGATANGSILLQAAHGGVGLQRQARPNPDGGFGDLVLGEGSVMQILPDDGDEPVVGTGSFRSSRIDMIGNRIVFDEDARLYAPGAQLTLHTERKSGDRDGTRDPNDSRIYLGEGAEIDIAGLHVTAAAQNSIRAELRANELRDNPLLRDGPLRGRTIWFDPRRGTSIADLAGYYDLIERDVSEMMTEGGTLTMTGFEIIAREGSTIDLSGGSVFHEAGYVRSTRLIGADGRLVPVELADPSQVYIGIEGDFIVNHSRWGTTENFVNAFARPDGRHEQAYSEGRNAGSLLLPSQVVIQAGISGLPRMAKDAFRIFEGEVRADVTVGEYQQGAPGGATIADVERVWRERPTGGTLEMGGSIEGFNGRDGVNIGGSVSIAEVGGLLPEDFDADGTLDVARGFQHILPTQWFDGGTFTNVTIYSGFASAILAGESAPLVPPGGVLTVGADVTMDLGAYGSLNFMGRQANIDGTLQAAGGSIRLEAAHAPTLDTFTPVYDFAEIPEADRPGIRLGANGLIDVSGRWSNDFRDGTSDVAPVLDGGSVELIGYAIRLAAGSRISADGGGHLSADGTTLTPGNGGSILIDNSVRYLNANPAPGSAPGDGALVLDGELTAYALGRGGTLAIDTVDDVMISDEPVLPGGLLEAGTAAPKDLYLAQDLLFLTGETLPFDADYMADLLDAGGVLVADASALASNANPVPVQAGWIVPEGMTVRSSTSSPVGPGRTFQAGMTVPAGTTLRSFGATTSNGTLPAGFTPPADAFPNGIQLNSSVSIRRPAGSVLASDFAVPQGSILPAGTTLDRVVEIRVPRHFAPDFFTQGGFSTFAVSGARSLTIASGTVLAPSVDTIRLDGVGRDIATGTRLAEAGRLEVLPEDLRQPMAFHFSTAPIDLVNGGFAISRIIAERFTGTDSVSAARNPGALTMETGAEIRMDSGSTVRLDAYIGDVFVDGVIETPGGTIGLQDTGWSNPPRLPRGLQIGANARLLAPGYVRVVPDGRDGRRAVESAGRITLGVSNINLSFGFELENILIDPNAVLDVSGVRAEADFMGDRGLGGRDGPLYSAAMVDGAAGSIEIRAVRGILGGDLRLAPGGETGRGGTLLISGQQGLIVAAGNGGDLPSVEPGVPIDAEVTRLIAFADRLNTTGADVLNLESPYDAILFDGNVSLRTRAALILRTPMLGRTNGDDNRVELESAYVSLGASDSDAISAPGFETDLTGELIVRAGLIDLQNQLALGCVTCADDAAAGAFASTQLISAGDIRFNSYATRFAFQAPAGLFSGGSILFDAAQVYVTSREQGFGANESMIPPDEAPGFLVEAAERIEVRGNGAAAPVPMSFGERLTLRAPVIVQGGVLRAPQGQIRLEGSESVTLLPGSLTSASLEGLVVPFGYVDSNGRFAGFIDPGEVPVKSVQLDGPDVSVEDGAVIDVSGGGDLLALAFGAGNGGSTNILAFDPSVERFAILPSLGAGPAPVNDGGATSNPNAPRGDGSTLVDPRLSVGDVVWLDAAPGLAAGYYTLLPAFYAALDGGLLIERVNSGDAPPPGAPHRAMTRADGAVIASGYRAVNGTPIREQGWSSFAVMDREVLGKYSLLNEISFNDYARALGETVGIRPRTPFDAGSVVLGATGTLRLEGQGRFGAGEGGLLGNLDISAQNIAVISGGATGPEGYVALDAGDLGAFGAASLLLGGVRTGAATGTTVTVNADNVIVSNDSASPLTGQELILAARDQVVIEEGAVIVAEGGTANDPNSLLLTGDGALLRLSSGDRVGIVRTGTTGAAGDLLIGEGASLSATGSLTFDSVRSLGLAESAVVQADQLDLATVRVNLGDVPEGEEGTNLSLAMLERLGAASDLLIRGHDSINLYGDLVLGNRDGSGATSLGAITFDTALLQGRTEGGETARITAGSLTLRNSGGAREAVAEAGPGTLTLDVDTLVLGPGQVDLAGYAEVSGDVGVIEAQGVGGLELAGDLTLASGRLTAASGADYGIRSAGDLAFTHANAPTGAVEAFGGRLTLEGLDVLVDTRVALPAGVFEVAASGDITLGDLASLDLAGVAVDFRDVARFAPGGTVRLTAGGHLAMAIGATIDVSGSERGGDAGRLVLTAGGTSSILGTLRGGAGDGYGGGGIDLDSGSVDDFAALNALLNSGGFDSSREIRLRDQSILLAAGERIEAHRVTLRSDSGEVRIAGTIAAAGTEAAPAGGEVRLIGGNGVTLDGTARIEAMAATVGEEDFAPSSGLVELVAEAGRVDVAGGALIDVSGGRESGGRITVRAEREGSGLAVDRLDGEFRGAREKALVGMARYETSEIDVAFASAMIGEASAWLAGAPVRAGWETGAGMRVGSDADLIVSSDINLAGRVGAGHLGLVAAGDLTVDATISDGFASAARNAALLERCSASYAFESGGDITLAEDSMVRTGTGDIRIDTGRDLTLADNQAVIYTAGRRTATEAGFDPASTRGRPLGEFPTLGGDISIAAGRDILAPLTRQTNSAWLFRYGHTNWTGDFRTSTVAQQTSWSIVFRNFEQGIGALGGGDVRIDAGRDARHLAVALPTTGHLTTPVGQVPTEMALHIRGGGDLALTTGRDLLGGMFMLGRGQADVRAGGDVIPSDQLALLRNNINSNLNGTGWVNRQVGALFGLMDAVVTVTAVGAVDIEAAYDPMRQGQVCENFSTCNGTTAGGQGSAFYGYSDRAALNAVAASGAVTYRNNPWASTDLSRGQGVFQVMMYTATGGDPRPRQNAIFGELPGTLRFASLQSSVYLEPRFAAISQLAPAPNGTIEFLARHDVRIPGGTTGIAMQDIAPEYRRTALRTFSVDAVGWFSNTSPLVGAPSAVNNFQRGFELLHGDDPDPARIYALEGSICSAPAAQLLCQSSLQLTLPKPLQMAAGQDIRVLANIQHNRPDAISVIAAGRDLVGPIINVTGQGALFLEAGRDVLKASGFTVDAIASGAPNSAQRNLALPLARGADITVLAGAASGTDWEGFADLYLDPANRADPDFPLSHPSNEGKVVQTYEAELADYLAGLGFGEVDDDALIETFNGLPDHSRQAFLQGVFFDELRATGLDYNDPESPRFQQSTRGYDAVARLFTADPETIERGGNIILNNQPIETRDGGDINILVPYGTLSIGTLFTPSFFDPNTSGIVTRRGGDIRIMTDRNIDLFTSRVFTLQGGDILMWTSNGDITAGAGAKTAVRQAPLTYALSNDGFTTVDVFGLQTGSGIGVLDALDGRDEDREPSRLDLIALRGEVNAGDAGIRVVGDANIAALRIVGVDNIQISGEAIGLPEIVEINTGALTAASSATSAVVAEATRLAERSRPAVQTELPTILNVRFLGFGQ